MISVALAAYNGQEYIIRQLESIKNQTVGVHEVIICDDGSTDKTVTLCREFIEKNSLDNWYVFENEKNVGFCLNFYGAIEKCKGDIIFLSDQDDEWTEDRVEVMTACMNAHPEISVLSSRYDIIDKDSKVIENSGVTYLGTKNDGSIEYVDPESLIGCSYIRGFSICMRSEAANLIKPIDLKSLLAHDWLISMLGCVTGKTAILNTVLAHYRYHLDNVSLSAMNKQNRRRELSKRILGLRESVEGHKYVATLFSDTTLKQKIEKFSEFEKRRIAFLESKNIFKGITLLFGLSHYNRYYKGNGLRVWVGDIVYTYKK